MLVFFAAFVVVAFFTLAVLVWAAHHFPNERGLRGRITQVRQLAQMLASPSWTTNPLYELWSGHLLTSRTSFLNLGYWRDACDLDAAGAAMADKVAEAAGMGPDDRVLDVGFGYGDQDVRWMTTRAPRSIDGVNLAPAQVDRAMWRVRRAGLADRVHLREGTATALPYADSTFDVITALECAFHFDTREAFLREAARVLVPGGRLVLADLVEVSTPRSWGQRALDEVRARLWQIPRANRVDIDGYRRALERAGFADVALEVVSADVFPPLRAAVRDALRDPGVQARLHPWHRNALSEWLYVALFTHDAPFSPLDYVIVSARLPRLTTTPTVQA